MFISNVKTHASDDKVNLGRHNSPEFMKEFLDTEIQIMGEARLKCAEDYWIKNRSVIS